MMEKFITIKISETSWNQLKKAKEEYKRHHPEYQQTFVSNNKVIFETTRYYLEN